MKYLRVVIILSVVLAAACSERNDLSDRGIERIYMPQAAAYDGGINNILPVPSATVNAPNYSYDSVSNVLKIHLGAKSSGLQKSGFTVHIDVDKDTLQTILNSSLKDAVPIPDGAYSLPAALTVPPGAAEGSFLLTVDFAKIISEHPDWYKNKLILPVRIKSAGGAVPVVPHLATTIVIIEAGNFMPAPPPSNLLSPAGWLTLKQKSTQTGTTTVTVHPNGDIHISNGKTPVYTNYLVYQSVEVKQGKKYNVNVDIGISGVINNSWEELYIGKAAPEEGGDYWDNKYWGLDWHCNASPLSGSMKDLQCLGANNDGLYTADFTGKLYFAFKVGSWNGVLESLTFSNIVFIEAQ